MAHVIKASSEDPLRDNLSGKRRTWCVKRFNDPLKKTERIAGHCWFCRIFVGCVSHGLFDCYVKTRTALYAHQRRRREERAAKFQIENLSILRFSFVHLSRWSLRRHDSTSMNRAVGLSFEKNHSVPASSWSTAAFDSRKIVS